MLAISRCWTIFRRACKTLPRRRVRRASEGALWTEELPSNSGSRTTRYPGPSADRGGRRPSGASDADDAHRDEIGIVVAGLGVDGKTYVLEDATMKAQPGAVGAMVASAL